MGSLFPVFMLICLPMFVSHILFKYTIWQWHGSIYPYGGKIHRRVRDTQVGDGHTEGGADTDLRWTQQGRQNHRGDRTHIGGWTYGLM